MALVKCPECGREISTQAATCPSCGYPMRAQPGEGRNQNALESPQVWSRGLLALGAWLVTPWIVRLIFALGVLVLAYFMFKGN
ncbi:zinc ribbon domain-containing protein [Diaphorobacter aerolatus]|uniref:Zinc ribbon domain-containing protein n=1 Tax=Diaphorobacter aerolatus TaxID=1288495 RepID=A0A7H0GMF6_9BURK|nr:zinc ribbon domain-containing protein [Diaphorobacter aerolatus]QNP49472.1 zinc ribbon domain-containing protein [Diaphorobacter aerolatus]